ncbi:MAG: glyoxylate/hydroxypyruvate reductase A [Pseudomonadota bacterium]
MTLNILFVGSDDDWAQFGPDLQSELSALPQKIDLRRDHAHEKTDYIVMAGSRILDDFSGFTRCKALLRLWAGVEDITRNDTITMPICRMVGGGLDQGMVEWVTAHTLRHHIGMDAHIHGQDGVWRNTVMAPLAKERPVTILGLGALGTACAKALAGLGFPVTGWSRSKKNVDGIRCLSGPVKDALKDAQIVVLLMPLTPDTKHVINMDTLAALPRGAFLLNPGRGPLIKDADLLAALDDGQIAHATLDTFRHEPLPEDDPYWAHPKVTVTPHIASATRADIAAKVIAENIQRGEAGDPFLHEVDRQAGY